MGFFENVEEAPLDPILGLNISFAADKRKNKVNLGAGIFKTKDLKSFILKSVKKAELLLIESEKSKDYLPIDGEQDYLSLTQELVFGKSPHHIYGAQTVGGTAALAVAGHFLKECELSTLYLSSPTWSNHIRIFQPIGFDIQTYPYFDWKQHKFDFEGLMDTLAKIPERSIVLLQVCCHNPTGLDPSWDQWKEICTLIQKRALFPFFDFVYQGFGENLEQDREVLSLFLNTGLECAVAVSHAKTFGLYAERPGVVFFVCHTSDQAQRIGSRIKMIIRGMYSNPPCHGARIVATILQNSDLKALWEEELAEMRKRIMQMRSLLALGLQQKAPGTFNFLTAQKGMFSYTGLRGEQVERLIADFGIYLPKDGRINVAGLSNDNLTYVVDAIAQVQQISLTN